MSDILHEVKSGKPGNDSLNLINIAADTTVDKDKTDDSRRTQTYGDLRQPPTKKLLMDIAQKADWRGDEDLKFLGKLEPNETKAIFDAIQVLKSARNDDEAFRSSQDDYDKRQSRANNMTRILQSAVKCDPDHIPVIAAALNCELIRQGLNSTYMGTEDRGTGIAIMNASGSGPMYFLDLAKGCLTV